jgi:hypothetical protein
VGCPPQGTDLPAGLLIGSFTSGTPSWVTSARARDTPWLRHRHWCHPATTRDAAVARWHGPERTEAR